jgi:hypothetical protein
MVRVRPKLQFHAHRFALSGCEELRWGNRRGNLVNRHTRFLLLTLL